MAELTTLARPYAKAAFEYARSSTQELKSWSEALALMAQVCEQSVVKKVLASPKLTSAEKADALIGVCGDKLNDNIKQFVNVLAENKRLGLLDEIYRVYEDLKSQLEKFVDIDVQTAFELPADIQKNLAEKLGQKLSSEVSLQTTIDKSLLGGIVIRAGDTVIDGSVRGRLAKLAETIGM